MGVHYDSQLRISSRSQLLRFRAQLDSNSNEDQLMTDLTAEMEDQFLTEYTAGIENQLVNDHNDGVEDQMVTEKEDLLVTEQTEWLENLLVTENSEGLEDQLVTEHSEGLKDLLVTGNTDNSVGLEDLLVTVHTEGLDDHVEENTTRLEDQFVTMKWRTSWCLSTQLGWRTSCGKNRSDQTMWRILMLSNIKVIIEKIFEK